ncbi:uncharacterized protein CLUP02_02092 [Colletotrichum lupini]|uniref:Uncharacterized protein n=2 Tax=Colletotrichum acutatum species complex TaxID=2707335 RepID=A0A9Q8SE82_9PEZI|nr:uncharacterized protein CLUP02_02092 [Colletotrichum lupini]KAK1472440.1 hypothetical protein CCUS01_05824 [Colletotrichum cuscutae]UQC75438.1 hypothetical protein CLUP02_02092 [Colletotrichum lupini]
MFPYRLPLFRPLVLSSAQEQGVTVPGEPSSPICLFGKPTMLAARGSWNNHTPTPVGSSQVPVDDPPFLSPPLLGAAQNGRVNSAILVAAAAVRIEPAGWLAVCCTSYQTCSHLRPSSVSPRLRGARDPVPPVQFEPVHH